MRSFLPTTLVQSHTKPRQYFIRPNLERVFNEIYCVDSVKLRFTYPASHLLSYLMSIDKRNAFYFCILLPNSVAPLKRSSLIFHPLKYEKISVTVPMKKQIRLPGKLIFVASQLHIMEAMANVQALVTFYMVYSCIRSNLDRLCCKHHRSPVTNVFCIQQKTCLSHKVVD